MVKEIMVQIMDESNKNKGKEIFDHLIDLEKKSSVKWEESFSMLCGIAGKCSLVLTGIKYLIGYREIELKEGKRRKPSALLKKDIALILQNSYTDNMYFPVKFETGAYFQDKDAKSWLTIIMDKNFILPDNLCEDLDKSICCSSALRGAFNALRCNCKDEIPLKVTLKLCEILNDLVDKTKDFTICIDKQERLGDQNSQNASTTSLKINKIKLSDQYPKLKQVLSKFDGSAEGKAAIDRILRKILNLGDGKTLRKYRQYLLDNFDHEKQEVS
jgi:hypothetical protein